MDTLPIELVFMIAVRTKSTMDYLRLSLANKHFGKLLTNKIWKLKAKHAFTKQIITHDFMGWQKEWLLNGKPHSNYDMPGVIDSDGQKEWFQHGVLHRDGDKPALIRWSGDKEWYQHGKFHRDGDKPARILHTGKKEWFVHGVLKRRIT